MRLISPPLLLALALPAVASADWIDAGTHELEADDELRYGRVPWSWLRVEAPG